MVPPPDVSVEVEFTFDADDEMMWAGVQCRSSTTGWYSLEIRFDGRFSISSETLLGTEQLLDWTESALIDTEGGVNLVRLDCVGDMLTAFIGDTEVGQVSDDAHVLGGAGVHAASPEETGPDSNLVVEFSNYAVRHP
jgi:hypothetical protein